MSDNFFPNITAIVLVALFTVGCIKINSIKTIEYHDNKQIKTKLYSKSDTTNLLQQNYLHLSYYENGSLRTRKRVKGILGPMKILKPKKYVLRNYDESGKLIFVNIYRNGIRRRNLTNEK